MQRFHSGGGELLDVEFIVNEQGQYNIFLKTFPKITMYLVVRFYILVYAYSHFILFGTFSLSYLYLRVCFYQI